MIFQKGKEVLYFSEGKFDSFFKKFVNKNINQIIFHCVKSVQIQENTDQKKFRIWTLLVLCSFSGRSCIIVFFSVKAKPYFTKFQQTFPKVHYLDFTIFSCELCSHKVYQKILVGRLFSFSWVKRFKFQLLLLKWFAWFEKCN